MKQSANTNPRIRELIMAILLALMGLGFVIAISYPRHNPCREIPIIVEETE